ncbi:hypothetical protein PhiSM_gp80 [Cellulophaga phage phiSM]|nr:hypothetical protein PhiSM_gp80 [Cellulophaga phage phiSM]AGO49399.1 hypothetical protein Phi3:1_gp80 [Cellulophaga phage phi3:1]
MSSTKLYALYVIYCIKSFYLQPFILDCRCSIYIFYVYTCIYYKYICVYRFYVLNSHYK